MDGLLCRVREARIAANFDDLVELAKLEKEWGCYGPKPSECSVMTPEQQAFEDAAVHMTPEDWDADNDWLASAGWGEM